MYKFVLLLPAKLSKLRFIIVESVLICFAFKNSVFALIDIDKYVVGQKHSPIEKIQEYEKMGLSIPIAHKGLSSQEQMIRFVENKNPHIDKDILSYLVKIYAVETKNEGINLDIAFAQMILETNYLKFGRNVITNQNNFAGLGVVHDGVSGHTFETIYLGVRVHIQHLAAYALTTPLNMTLVDPRFKYVRRGSAPLLKDLTGKWATDPHYAEKIYRIILGILKTAD